MGEKLKPAPDRPGVRKCCKILENMERMHHEKPEMIKTRCKICGANHYRLMAEPGLLGAQINPLG